MKRGEVSQFHRYYPRPVFLGSINSVKATLEKNCFELRFDAKSFNAMHQSLHFTRGRSIHLERLSSVVFHIPVFCIVPPIYQTEELSPGGRVPYVTAALFQAFSGRPLRYKAVLNRASFFWYVLTVYWICAFSCRRSVGPGVPFQIGCVQPFWILSMLRSCRTSESMELFKFFSFSSIALHGLLSFN